MTIKKLAVLGSVLAGAALLQNKERRERLMRSATDFLHNTRERLSRTGETLSEKAEQATSSFSQGSSGFGDSTSAPSYSETAGQQGRSGIY